MNIYIDTGAYKGLTIKAFKNTEEYTPDFKLYAFEPNRHAKIHKKSRGAVVYKKAVWIKDCNMPFYTNKKHLACQGATLLKEKTSGGLDKKHPMEVEAIDFGKWIMETFKKTDNIIVKMDIEGAEYTVLPRMIEDGSIEYINKLYLETHSNRVGLKPEDDEKLYKMLAQVKSLVVAKEYAHLTYKKDKCINQ